MEGVLTILVISVVALNHVGKSENVCGRMNTTISMFYEYQNAQAAVTWRRQDLSILSVVSNPGCSSTLNNSRYTFLCEDGDKRFVLQVNNPVDGELYYIGTIDDNRTFVIQDKGALSLSDDSSACKLDTEVQLVCTIRCSKPEPRLTWKLRNTSGTLQNLPGGVESIITGCQSGYFSKNSTITISNTTTALDGLDNYTIICEASYPDCNIPTTTDRVNSSCSKDPTTTSIENTTVAQSSISQTSTSGVTTSSDSSSSTPLSSSSLPSTSQQVTTNGASTTPNTSPPGVLSNEMLAVIIASSVVGCILLVVIILIIVFCVIRKRKRNPQKVQNPGDYSYSNKGYNYNRRPDMHSSKSNHHSRHTPRQMNFAEFQRQDHQRGPALTGRPYGHHPGYQLYNYPSKSEYKQPSRNKSSATEHNASSRDYPRSDKYRDPNKNYNYVDRNRDFNQEYYIRPYYQEYKQSSRNMSSAPKHNASSRHHPRSDKYRDPNKNYNYVDEKHDFNQEYYIRPYAGGYPSRSGDYRYYR